MGLWGFFLSTTGKHQLLVIYSCPILHFFLVVWHNEYYISVLKYTACLSACVKLQETNNEDQKNPIKSDCVSLMISIDSKSTQQLETIEGNLQGLICVEYQFSAQMHFRK